MNLAEGDYRGSDVSLVVIDRNSGAILKQKSYPYKGFVGGLMACKGKIYVPLNFKMFYCQEKKVDFLALSSNNLLALLNLVWNNPTQKSKICRFLE